MLCFYMCFAARLIALGQPYPARFHANAGGKLLADPAKFKRAITKRYPLMTVLFNIAFAALGDPCSTLIERFAFGLASQRRTQIGGCGFGWVELQLIQKPAQRGLVLAIDRNRPILRPSPISANFCSKLLSFGRPAVGSALCWERLGADALINESWLSLLRFRTGCPAHLHQSECQCASVRPGLGKPSVWRWSERYFEEGVDVLLRDKTRPASNPELAGEKVAMTLELTLNPPPHEEATRWTTWAMSERSGVSRVMVHRVWQQNGLVPHRFRQFKPSKDSNFAAKVNDIKC